MRAQKNGVGMYFLVIAFILLVFSTAFAEETLKIGGSGSAIGVMKLLGAAFEQAHPDAKVQVVLGLGSAGGVKAVSQGAIDIGLSGRPLKDEELALKLSIKEYGKTPFVFATRKDVAVRGVTTEALVKIYSGSKTKWTDGKHIRLILRAPFESDTLTARKISPEMSAAIDSALARKGQLMATTDQDTADLIEATPGGFGFTTLTLLLSEKRPLKALSFNGTVPSVKTLAGGVYPLSKPLYLVVRPDPSPAAQKFIAFISSHKGRRILEDNGVVPVNK